MKLSFSGIALTILSCAGLSAAPNYYLFNGDGSTGYQVDPGTGTLVNTFSTFSLGYPVAIVGDKIRLGHRDDGSGAEYNLDGTPTGVTFSGGFGFTQLLDGTSDGIYNYGVECCGGTNSIMRADLSWQNGSVLFDLPTDGTGVTYDSSAGTLWVSFFDSSVRQYTMAGVELSSFGVDGYGAALAYEAATDTLWMHHQTGPNVSQYSKTGEHLQTVTIDNWSPGNIYGGEIANSPVPEPATVGMMGFGLVAVALRCRRKKA